MSRKLHILGDGRHGASQVASRTHQYDVELMTTDPAVHHSRARVPYGDIVYPEARVRVPYGDIVYPEARVRVPYGDVVYPEMEAGEDVAQVLPCPCASVV